MNFIDLLKATSFFLIKIHKNIKIWLAKYKIA